MFGLTRGVIDTRALRDAVAAAEHGAILIFEGVSRDHFDGQRVTELWYEAYEALATAQLAALVADTEARWPGVRVAIVHRLGLVPIGEAAVVIAVSGGHRPETYEASRYALEALKSRVPIWKQERYIDGSTWKANG